MALAAISAVALAPWPAPARADDADNLLIVDCLLPGRIQRLGNAATYATARKAVQTSAADCRRRGGEYTESNGQTYANLMRIWMPLARAGDVEAQTNLGEIFEKGLGGPPQPDLAVQWYQLAADQGSARAQVNLGSLYERGFGVPRDTRKAMELYRRATGLAGLPVATGPSSEEVNRLRQERDTLSQQLQSERRQRESLEAELEAIRKRLSGERSSLQQQQLELDAARRELAARSQAVEQQRAARTTTVATTVPDRQAAQRLAQLQRQYDDQARLVADRDAQLKALQASVRQLESQSNSLQVQLASAEQRRQADVTAARGETEAVRQQLSTATAELRRANDDLAARIATIDQQRAEVAGLKRQLASAQSAGGSASSQQKAIEATLRKRESELAESQRKLIDISAVLERLQKEARGTAPATTAAARPYRVPPGVEFGRYHALVIGNNNYRFGPKLRTAVADARSVADVLKRRYGFDTMVLIDANRYQILSALNTMREKLTAEDNLLIYFAGHGELDVANDRGYWLPVDAETNSNANWIASYQVTDILRASTAKQIMIVADSCFSGTLTRSAVGKLSAGLTEDEKVRFYKAMTERRTRVALTSGGDQPVLDSGGGAHSVFAASFLQTLETNSEVLEAQKLAQRVIQRVAISPDAAKIAQVPIYAPLSFAGHEAGDFFFVPTS